MKSEEMWKICFNFFEVPKKIVLLYKLINIFSLIKELAVICGNMEVLVHLRRFSSLALHPQPVQCCQYHFSIILDRNMKNRSFFLIWNFFHVFK